MPDRVTFTRSSAERIARVVRRVEAGNRGGQPLTFEPRIGGGGKVFRMATFTGAWSKNTFHTVTLVDATQTLSVNNLLFPVPQLSDNTTSPTYCAIAKDRGTWQLVNIEFVQHTALSAVSLQPDALQFDRRVILGPGKTNTTTGITITECDNEAASAEQLQFFLG